MSSGKETKDTSSSVAKEKSYNEYVEIRVGIIEEIKNVEDYKEVISHDCSVLENSLHELEEDFKKECISTCHHVLNEEEFKIPKYQETKEKVRALRTQIGACRDEEHQHTERLVDLNQRLDSINKSMEKFKRERSSVLEKRIESAFPTCQRCVICQSLLTIPVNGHWFECSFPGKDGRARCRVPYCLDCTREFFKLNEPIQNRSHIACPICRGSTRPYVPRNASDVYSVDEREMNHLDGFINLLSDGEALVECPKCSQWFNTIRDLWKHKRGEGVSPCPKSTRRCVQCNNSIIAEFLVNDVCNRCRQVMGQDGSSADQADDSVGSSYHPRGGYHQRGRHAYRTVYHYDN